MRPACSQSAAMRAIESGVINRASGPAVRPIHTSSPVFTACLTAVTASSELQRFRKRSDHIRTPRANLPSHGVPFRFGNRVSVEAGSNRQADPCCLRVLTQGPSKLFFFCLELDPSPGQFNRLSREVSPTFAAVPALGSCWQCGRTHPPRRIQHGSRDQVRRIRNGGRTPSTRVQRDPSGNQLRAQGTIKQGDHASARPVSSNAFLFCTTQIKLSSSEHGYLVDDVEAIRRGNEKVG